MPPSGGRRGRSGICGNSSAGPRAGAPAPPICRRGGRLSHASHGFFPILNRGDGAILYCFIFFYIAFAGAGPWSLDALLRKRG
jgi:hypothetical protein